MMANVTIHQLNSRGSGKAYLNVNECDGFISVLAHVYTCPIYIAWYGNMFYLYIFDSQEWADEFFEENGSNFTKITKIEPCNKDDGEV